MAGAVSPCDMAPAKAAAWAWSTAVTSNWTRAAESQQQEELAPALPQLLAVVSVVLVTCTRAAAAAGRPTRDATHLAKAKAPVPSALGPHTSTSPVTTWQL